MFFPACERRKALYKSDQQQQQLHTANTPASSDKLLDECHLLFELPQTLLLHHLVPLRLAHALVGFAQRPQRLVVILVLVYLHLQ